MRHALILLAAWAVLQAQVPAPVGGDASNMTVTPTGTTPANKLSALVRQVMPSGGLILWASNSGNDSNNCLALATACATVQHAVDLAMANYDARSGGHAMQVADINLAAGQTFTECVLVQGRPVGNGFITIHGSGAPSTITCPGSGNTLTATNNADLRIKNLILGGTPSQWCLGAQYNSFIQIIDQTVTFADCGSTGAQIDISRNSTLQSLAGYSISGGGQSHWHAHEGGVIVTDATTLTFVGAGPIAYNAYFAGASFGRINAIGTTYTNAGIVTGAKFTLNRLGSLRTAATGEGDITILPGNTPGNVVSNSVYDGYGTGGWVSRLASGNTVDVVGTTDALVIRNSYDGRDRTETLSDCTATTGPWRLVTIKDGLGNANISPIVVSAPTSTIDGVPFYALNTAWGAVSLFCNGATGWVTTSNAQRGAVLLGSGAVPVSHTGDTAEFTFATVTVPANAMGLNGRLQLRGIWSFTGSTNSKSARARLGGAGGTAYIAATTATATNITLNATEIIANRNAANSQVSMSAAIGSGQVGFGTAALVTSAINTAAATTVVFTGQLTNAGETIALESYDVTLLP
jgi:hypothetical protein